MTKVIEMVLPWKLKYPVLTDLIVDQEEKQN